MTVTAQPKIGQQVWFHTEHDVHSAQITHVWNDHCVNLDNGSPSVPHASTVTGATSMFFTYGRRDGINPHEWDD